jgi:hypothetical protein
MLAVTAVPFAIGLVVGVGSFAGLTYYLVEEESRRPVRWEPAVAHAGPHVSHLRLAMIGVIFTMWSLWATARPVSGWR